MKVSPTRFVTSADGTRIAYDTNGSGPALVIVEGALCQRSMGAAANLRESLDKHFTVHAYDRRGRGESGPGETSYDVQREVEDLAAVIAATGGTPYVFAASSGAVLALEAARNGVAMEKLAVYEAPLVVDDTHAPHDPTLAEQVERLVAAGDPAGAVKLFMRTVDAPAPMVAVMPLLPVWKKLKAVAPTLAHDFRIVLPLAQAKPLPAGYYADVKPETLVLAGGKSPQHMRNAQAAIVAQLPHGRLVTLPRQTHMIRARATTPALLDHFVG